MQGRRAVAIAISGRTSSLPHAFRVHSLGVYAIVTHIGEETELSRNATTVLSVRLSDRSNQRLQILAWHALLLRAASDGLD
jgi:hypothetical protein